MVPVKHHWLDRAIQVYNYHARQCRDEDSWTLSKTAITLNRSLGSVSQDITIARWSKTHESRLRKFRSMRDALDYIKKHQRELNITEIE